MDCVVPYRPREILVCKYVNVSTYTYRRESLRLGGTLPLFLYIYICFQDLSEHSQGQCKGRFTQFFLKTNSLEKPKTLILLP